MVKNCNIPKGGYCICDDGCGCYEPANNQYSLYNEEYVGTNGDDQVDVGGPNLGY
jgi:hypothetical protein